MNVPDPEQRRFPAGNGAWPAAGGAPSGARRPRKRTVWVVAGLAALLLAGTGCAALVVQSQAHAATELQEGRRIEALAAEVEALRAEATARAAATPTPAPTAAPPPAAPLTPEQAVAPVAPVAPAAPAVPVAPAPKAPAAPPTPQMGVPYAAGNWEYTVHEVTRTKSLGDRFLKDDAKGEYVVVGVTLKNVGKENFTLNSHDFTLYDAAGVKYNTGSSSGAGTWAKAHGYDGGALTFSTGQMPPGVPVKYVLVFDTAPGAEGLSLSLNQARVNVALDSEAEAPRAEAAAGAGVAAVPPPAPPAAPQPPPPLAPEQAVAGGACGVESAVRHSNTVWEAAIRARDAGLLDQVYTAKQLAGEREAIARYRRENQTRFVHLLSFRVTDCKLTGGETATLAAEEEWTDRMTDAAGRVIRSKDPWKIAVTYDLVRVGGRWLVGGTDIRER